MWAKEFRLAVFFSIYQIFFWEERIFSSRDQNFSLDSIDIDYDLILEQVYQEVFLKKKLSKQKTKFTQTLESQVSTDVTQRLLEKNEPLTDSSADSENSDKHLDYPVSYAFENLLDKKSFFQDHHLENYLNLNKELEPHFFKLLTDNLAKYFDRQVKAEVLTQIQRQITLFRENKIDLVTILSKYAKCWEQTFPIIKACLCTFLLEKRDIREQIEQQPSVFNKLVSAYIRLTQRYISSKNVSLVHAIVSKFNYDQQKTNRELVQV